MLKKIIISRVNGQDGAYLAEKLLNKKYLRQNELHYLKGNSSKAKKELKWKPRYTLDKLIDEMINFELEKLKV